MTSHDWFIENRTAFVIRTLEPDEERAFHEHLGGCEECRRETARIEHELGWLPMGVAPVTPRPGLSRAVVDAALGSRPRATGWLVPAAVAASVLVAVGAWGWAATRVAGLRQAFETEQGRLRAELAMARDTLGIIREAAVVRHATITMGAKKGGLVIFADERTHRWNVVVYGLPAPVAGEVCQFWFITDSGMVKSVPIHTGAGGPAFLTLGMPKAPGKVMGAALTMEAEGSTSPSPEGTELAHVMM
jgi:hypothetical protein